MPTNKLAKISQQPESNSTEQIIREGLVKIAELYHKNGAPYPLTPRLTQIWIEVLGDLEPDVCAAAFRKFMQVGCRRGFPIPSDVRALIDAAMEGNLEDEWQALLDYCANWVNRDLGPRGPRLPAEIDHAAHAAGGVYFLESCLEHDLIFAKQRFIEDLTRQRKTGDIAGFLPPSELRGMLEAAASRFALPETARSAPICRVEHSESVPRPLTRKVERAGDLDALIRQGERLWAALHGPAKSVGGAG